MDLFTQLNKTSFYATLRTKEQLGMFILKGESYHMKDTLFGAVHVLKQEYKVLGKILVWNLLMYFRVEIQSNDYDPNYLDSRIENCMNICRVGCSFVVSNGCAGKPSGFES